MTDPVRLTCLDISVNLVEEQYGMQDSPESLIELLNLEFPDDNYTIEELHEMSYIQYENAQTGILFEHLGLTHHYEERNI